MNANVNDNNSDNIPNLDSFLGYINDMHKLDVNSTPAEINHTNVHPMVDDAFAALQNAEYFDISEIQSQAMSCTATTMLNGVVTTFKVIDAGDPEKGEPAVFIVDSDQIFNLINDTCTISRVVVDMVTRRWEEEHGQSSVS